MPVNQQLPECLPITLHLAVVFCLLAIGWLLTFSGEEFQSETVITESGIITATLMKISTAIFSNVA